MLFNVRVCINTSRSQCCVLSQQSPFLSLQSPYIQSPLLSLQSPYNLPLLSLRPPLLSLRYSILSPRSPPSLDIIFPVCTVHPPQGCAVPSSLPSLHPLSPTRCLLSSVLPPGCAFLSHILLSATCSILPSFTPHHPGHKNCHMKKKWTKSSSHSGNICLRLQFKAFCVYCNRL